MAKITTRAENYSEWYNQLVQQAEMAENSSVRWCMVIKPYGFAIWENIKDVLDKMFKNTWHQNAAFPLLIPKSFFTKEASHVAWFAKECAVVTHYRLKNDPDWKWIIVDPEAKLEEELIVRPTSETIIWDSYKRWINSYRDLPILVNQWANVMRWEMRTRIFLRTAEFFWQEWHTAHATAEEANAEALKMLDVYRDFAENFLAMSPVIGKKPAHDRFAGALETYAIEPMMQDFKALQAGTSHFLGQNFGKAFDVQFTNQNNELEYVRWTSRWVSTRLIWWLIMSHSDDNGLVLPPLLAPYHVVIVPIFKVQEDLDDIMSYLKPLIDKMDNASLDTHSKYIKNSIKIQYKIDSDTQTTPGRKFSEYEMKWIPLRVTVWKRDLENWEVEVFNRITEEKTMMKLEDLVDNLENILLKQQKDLYEKNKAFREANTYYVDTYDEFKGKIEKGFIFAHWDWTAETAEKIQEETKATIRCIPNEWFVKQNDKWVDMISWKESVWRVLFAKSY